MKKIIEYLIYIYISLSMFSGVLVKIFSGNSRLLFLKTILPELVLILLCILITIIMLKDGAKRKKNNYIRILFFYFTAVIICNLPFVNTIKAVLYVVRDIYLPFVVLFLSNEVEIFNSDEIKTIFNKIYKIVIIQIIFGFILAIVQNKLGWQWSSRFYAGYEFYGKDAVTGIKIWSTNGVLRVPSLAGDSTLFAFYNILSYLIIKNSKLKFKNILILLCFFNIFLSTNKTCIIILLIDILLEVIRKVNKASKAIVIYIIMTLFIISMLGLYTLRPEFFSTLFIRFDNWNYIFDKFKVINPIGNLFNIGAGVNGFEAVFDNSYLYILFSYGFFGVCIYILALIRIYKSNKNHRIIVDMIKVVFIGGVTTNIFQGRVFFIQFCILTLIFSNSFKSAINKKVY